MGKRIISQRRGRGSLTYRVPEKLPRHSIRFSTLNGKVIDIVKDPLRDAPLARIQYEDSSKGFVVAPESIGVGESIEKYLMPLSKIKEGSRVFCIETSPNSGPKLCRSPGSAATLVSKSEKLCVIQLPSKKSKKLHSNCRAMLGVPAGEGRSEKPFVKAGNKYHLMHKRGKLYPRTSGKAMNVVDHPYGGSGGGKVRPPVSRTAPPGRKVGTVAPRRTGKKK